MDFEDLMEFVSSLAMCILAVAAAILSVIVVLLIFCIVFNCVATL